MAVPIGRESCVRHSVRYDIPGGSCGDPLSPTSEMVTTPPASGKASATWFPAQSATSLLPDTEQVSTTIPGLPVRVRMAICTLALTVPAGTVSSPEATLKPPDVGTKVRQLVEEGQRLASIKPLPAATLAWQAVTAHNSVGTYSPARLGAGRAARLTAG
jgi:hypothetical protein